MTNRVMNFNAGPATLPLPALERAQRELLDFAGTGMCVMEHRTAARSTRRSTTRRSRSCARSSRVPATHEVLFLQGGASQQFAQVPLNFLHTGSCADYVVTGALGEKALAEAAIVATHGRRARCTSPRAPGWGRSRSRTFARRHASGARRSTRTPAYVHFTCNETINGIQFANEPGEAFPDFGGVPVVCDMSSDFMWRPIDVSRFALIYAGAQKNIGPSGLVVVIAQKDFVARGRKDIPNIFQYRAFAEANSLLNTPPTFAIYLVRNVLSWLEGDGRARGHREAEPREGAPRSTPRSTRTRGSTVARWSRRAARS